MHSAPARNLFVVPGLFVSLLALPEVIAADLNSCEPGVTATFTEGAPRDNFEFSNVSSGAWQIESITIDLENSGGKLIFDTTEGGDGVEVFQQYKTETGDATLAKVTQPQDGDTRMHLTFENFAPQQSFRFSIDVDDTLKQSALGQIRVTGGELSGAALTVTFAAFGEADEASTAASPVTLTGFYGEDNQTIIANPDC